MNWMQQLEQVYSNNEKYVGEFEERYQQRITLLPVSHMMQNAQIEILLSPEGNFIEAKVVHKEHARTIVPVTLASANRTSASAPHFLHDKLAYVAGDYVAFGGNEKRAAYYNDYINQMQLWVNDRHVPQRVQAIYDYVKKGTVIADLVREKVLLVDNQNKIMTKWTDKEKPLIFQVVAGDVLDAFVRFDVLHTTYDEPAVWEDKKLFDAYIAFFNQHYLEEQDVCYITGRQVALTSQHGARIRNAGDMSKLISSNDSVGYTYRGRFAKPSEAVQIGYEVSQKAHHALRWLMQRQSMYIDSRYFITFGIENPTIIDPFESSIGLISSSTNKKYTAEIEADALHQAIKGYKNQLTKDKVKNIIVIAMDAATSGRLAIVYYQQFHTDLFLDNIEHWHNTCKWLQFIKDEETKKVLRIEGTPSTYRIVEAVYGSKADPRIKKQLYTRLLPCIVEKKPIPMDIIRLIFNRIKNPASFKNLTESWEGVLNVACALVLKLHEGEGYTMALQKDNVTRDYLFGRLLGVAEVMEKRILEDREKGKKDKDRRSTNATRYFNAFIQNPARTWLVIRRQLQPYFMRQAIDVEYYAMLLQQIEDQITPERMNNQQLSPLFILGYSSQIQDMYKKKEDVSNDNIEE
ncbi:type I-C CRISPR-associated protein Cas8c/Csd1 [Lysinibacillus sp. FSL K6-0232]|uniref:type I-C CRISPR-associated protein Cas8c/Csd1 n=1 Tax=unclassified Lysinibacillus TaxID=2636778 RepID=UPI0030FCB7DB